MKTLFLGSVNERSGKSMVALGLALNHPKKVGYFKPFRETLRTDGDRLIDQDAYLMKHALGLKADEEQLSPFAYDIYKPVTMDQIVESYKAVQEPGRDMLVEGTRDILIGFLHNLSGMAIAEAIDAEVVLVSAKQPGSMDKLVMLTQLLQSYKINFKGVILNMSFKPEARALLEEREIKVLGSIPAAPELKHFTVREVADALSARVIVEEGFFNNVEDVMIGAMQPEAAIKFMRRMARKALITGGDRTDILMAALATDTSCLVLTGGLYPDKQVIAKAYESRVPILLTSHDTLRAAELIDHLIARIDPDNKKKIEKIKHLVADNVDLKAIWG
jgi:BioD-like phosphotransacetylase family protein